MTVTRVEHEPGRFWVLSETDGLPYLVDLDHDGQPYCSCAIIHNRTDADAMCKHIRYVQDLQAIAAVLNKIPVHERQPQTHVDH